MTEQQYTTPQPTSSGYGAGSQPAQNRQTANVQGVQQPVQGVQVGQSQGVVTQPTSKPPKKKKKGKKGRIALVVVLVLGLVCGGYVGIDFYMNNVAIKYEYDTSVLGVAGDQKLCNVEVEKMPKQEGTNYVYSASEYISSAFGIRIKKKEDIVPADNIITEIDTQRSAVSVPDDNRIQVDNSDLTNFGIKNEVDALVNTIAKCEAIENDKTTKYLSVDEINSLYRPLGQKSLEQYKALKTSLVKHFADLADQNKTVQPLTTAEIKDYAAKFGLINFHESVDFCYKGIENQKNTFDVAACVFKKDLKSIWFQEDKNRLPIYDSDTVKHEISHHIITVLCGDSWPRWHDLNYGTYTAESLANAYAIKYLGASENVYLSSAWLADPSNPLTSSIKSIDENMDSIIHYAEYEKHPMDDEAAARVFRGECSASSFYY